jgi:hypothetical protein
MWGKPASRQRSPAPCAGRCRRTSVIMGCSRSWASVTVLRLLSGSSHRTARIAARWRRRACGSGAAGAGRHPDDRGVDLATGDGLERLVVLLGHGDLDRGMRAMKVAKRLPQWSTGRTDPQPSMGRRAAGDLIPTSLGGERRARVCGKAPRPPREPDRAPIAMKERLPSSRSGDGSARDGAGRPDADGGARNCLSATATKYVSCLRS